MPATRRRCSTRWSSLPSSSTPCSRRATDSRRARQTPAAAPRRTLGASQRASLRHRAAAPGASARTRQHRQASAGAGLRLESRAAHATTAGRGDTTRSPGLRQRPYRRPTARIAPLLAPFGALSGADVGKPDRSIVDSPDDTLRFTHSAKAAQTQFFHGLLVHARSDSPLIRGPGNWSA